jgi:uroporphyrinogen decarboxylase
LRNQSSGFFRMNAAGLTSRRRVELALNHQEPDRVPYDLGGTILTGIHHQAYRRLRTHLGLPEVEIDIEDPVQQLARVHEDVKQRLAVDVYGLSPSKPRGIGKPLWSEDGYDKLVDEWGIEWWKPQDGGFYYDMRRHPLADIDTVSGLEKYRFPDPLDPGRYERMTERADELMNQRQVGYVLGRNAPGILEIALWMRGFENFFCDMVVNQPFAEALLDAIMEVKMRYWERALELVGPNVMIVSEADDLASQDRCLVRPALYRKLIKPRHTRLFAFIRKHARAPVKIFYHSCGAIASLIPDLIESGVDVLNPVQVSAAGMDTRELKKNFGKDITFYGGGVDTQQVLPRGTPAQVRDEVKRRIDDLAPGGGFIFTTVHNIQADVPPENLMAMWEAMREFGMRN